MIPASASAAIVQLPLHPGMQSQLIGPLPHVLGAQSWINAPPAITMHTSPTLQLPPLNAPMHIVVSPQGELSTTQTPLEQRATVRPASAQSS